MQNDGHWYAVRGEEQAGPFTNEQLRAHAEQGDLKPDDQVWRPGFEDWQRAGDVPGLLRPPERPSSPPPPPVLQESSPATPPLPQRVALEAPTQAEDIQPDAKLVGVTGAATERLSGRRGPHKNPYFAPVSGGIFAALIVAAMIWGWKLASTGTKQDHAEAPIPEKEESIAPQPGPTVTDPQTREKREQLGASKLPDGIPRPRLLHEGRSRPVPLAADANIDEVRDLLAQAERRIEGGDINGAREILVTLEGTAPGPAAFALAETYDPNMLGAWGTRGVVADIAKARALYIRALDLGVSRAQLRLEQLR